MYGRIQRTLPVNYAGAGREQGLYRRFALCGFYAEMIGQILRTFKIKKNVEHYRRVTYTNLLTSGGLRKGDCGKRDYLRIRQTGGREKSLPLFFRGYYS